MHDEIAGTCPCLCVKGFGAQTTFIKQTALITLKGFEYIM